MSETPFEIKARAYRLLTEKTEQELIEVEQRINDLMSHRSTLMDRIRSMRLTLLLSEAVETKLQEGE